MGLLDLFFKISSEPGKQSKVYVDENGYFRFKDSNKLVHRWVVEKKLGRKLKSGEVVHHINRNKRDNTPENLHVFPNQAAHDEQHKKDAKNFGAEYSYMGKNKRITLHYIFKGFWK
jgi:hypothetical protein